MLMAWCFSTRASVATMLTTHPCISRCLRVKNRWIHQFISKSLVISMAQCKTVVTPVRYPFNNALSLLQTCIERSVSSYENIRRERCLWFWDIPTESLDVSNWCIPRANREVIRKVYPVVTSSSHSLNNPTFFFFFFFFTKLILFHLSLYFFACVACFYFVI